MSIFSGFPGTLVSLISASLLLLTVGIDNASGHLVFPRTSPEGNFINCCHHIPLKYETVENGRFSINEESLFRLINPCLACKYPPMLKLPYPVRKDISHHFSEYIGCYAQHKDNRGSFIYPHCVWIIHSPPNSHNMNQ